LGGLSGNQQFKWWLVYEILGKSGNEKSDSDPIEIGRSYTRAEKSGARALGGLTDVKTTKSDKDIDDFISRWISKKSKIQKIGL